MVCNGKVNVGDLLAGDDGLRVVIVEGFWQMLVVAC